jgi:hypothetical protein
MPSPSIPWPTSSSPGERPAESQGKLVNVYAEQEGEQIVYKRVPGLSLFCDPAEDYPRGFLEVDDVLYAAYEGVVKRITSAGAVTTLTGALVGTGKVTWAKNNAATPDVVVVNHLGAYSVTSTTVSTFADTDLPSAPLCCAGLDGYIFFGFNDGKIYATDLNAVTVNALAFTTAEANPDGVARLIVSGRQLFAFGGASIEVFQNVGTSPFPLARSAVIPVGLKGQWAVAGAQDGWDGQPIFVASDGTVRQLNGYDPAIISTRAVERSIATITDTTNLEAYVYTFLGQAIWGLRGPDFCWEFNVSTRQWHERASYGLDTWRGSQTVRAFDKWLVGDTEGTELLEIDATEREERGNALVCTAESKAVRQFPARFVVRRADFMFSVGVGNASGADATETDPQVMLSWSDDGGATWSTPLQRDLGEQGQYGTMVSLFRCGMTTPHGRRWRWSVSDPVDLIFLGATMDAEERRII